MQRGEGAKESVLARASSDARQAMSAGRPKKKGTAGDDPGSEPGLSPAVPARDDGAGSVVAVPKDRRPLGKHTMPGPSIACLTETLRSLCAPNAALHR